MIKEYTKGEAKQLSKNFKSTEFDCKGKHCCGITKIDSDLVGFLQMIRANFGVAVVINSGYRCKEHNKAVGGASKSKHLEGMAADIKVKGIEPIEVAKYCESIGVKGIGLYEWGCHIDTRTKKGFWKTDKQIKVDTFGGNTDENIKEWQKAAIADGFDFKSGADGIWGAECEAVAEKAICKKRIIYKYKNLTKIVQRAVAIEADGKYGTNTKKAVQKWQGLVGLTADGVVGKNTWKKILGVK
jgi:hypothetical protein